MSNVLTTRVNCVDLTDYELGHRLWQSRGSLPGSPSKTMAEGYRKAATEYFCTQQADRRTAFRNGTYVPLVRFFRDVEGIVVGDSESHAIHPLIVGAKQSKPYMFALVFGESVR